MALPTQIVQIPASGGLAQHVESRVVEPGSWLTLENYVYDKAGALRKRPGFGALTTLTSDGGTLPPISKLAATSAGELTAIGLDPGDDDGARRLYSYSPALLQWSNRDSVCPASLLRTPLVRTPYDLRGGCVAISNGKRFVTYALSGVGILLKVFEIATGAVLYDDAIVVTTLLQHTLLAIGDTVLLLWNDTKYIKALKIDGATMSQGTATTIITTATSANVTEWDACVLSATVFGVALVSNGHVTAVEVYTITLASLATAASTTVAATSVTALSISGDATVVSIALADVVGATTSVLHAPLLASTLAPIVATVTMQAGLYAVNNVVVHRGADTRTYVVWDGSDPVNEDGVFLRIASSAYAVLGSAYRTLMHTAIWCKPFSVGLQAYVACSGALTGAPPHPQGGVLVCLSDSLLGTEPLTLCGYFATADGYENATVNAPTKPTPALVSTDGSDGDVYELPMTVYSEVLPVPKAGLDVVSLDFQPLQAALWATTQSNGLLLQTGAFTGSYDGQSVVELGFMHPPETVPGPPSAFMGGIDTVGTYKYIAVYTWVDGKGNRHYSGESAVSSVTLAAPDVPAKVIVSVTSCAATRRGDASDGTGRDVEVWLYRTQADKEVFYRVGDSGRNVRTTHKVTINDATADSVMMLTAVPIYTAGGVLEAQPPPASRALCSHKSRVWLASADDPRSVWFSQLTVQGEAPRFNAELSLRIDDSPDGITALAPLDDKLIIFTPTRIYLVQGDGPNDTGADGSFGGPFLLTSTAGCLDARSVVTFAGGVMFQSAQGFCLLNSGLQVSYVGAPAEDTMRAYPDVLSGTLDAARSRIVYLLRGYIGAVLDGAEVIPAHYETRFAVFDFQHGGVWMTWAIDGSDVQTAATLWRGLNVYGDDAAVCLEAFGSYPGLDPSGNAAVAGLETPWIKASALDGYQLTRHVLINGKQDGYGLATVELMNDYSDTVLQTATFDATAAPDIVGLPTERLDVHVANQKASAIKIRITDEYTGGLTAQERLGMSIASIALEIGVKQGRAKLPTANRK
jgi:hypothetical protein